jgi:hypothetical protein
MSESFSVRDESWSKKFEETSAYASALIDVSQFERWFARWTVIAGAVATYMVWRLEPSRDYWVVTGLTTACGAIVFPMIAGWIYSKKLIRDLKRRFGE